MWRHHELYVRKKSEILPILRCWMVLVFECLSLNAFSNGSQTYLNTMSFCLGFSPYTKQNIISKESKHLLHDSKYQSLTIKSHLQFLKASNPIWDRTETLCMMPWQNTVRRSLFLDWWDQNFETKIYQSIQKITLNLMI